MGPKKAKTKMPVDGVDTTSMSREQLEAFCIRLREELDREREERNFFQLERDKLRTFWEITRQQLEESRAQERNQDRAIDELEEKHQAEVKVYKQKVKHLLYEHQCNLSELQVESMVSLKQAQDDYNAMEQQLLKDKKDLKEQVHEMELKHLEEMKQLKIDHSAEVSRVREQLESDSAELEKKYEARLTNQAEEQSMREKMEQAEVETRKNQHIVDLTKQHEMAFQEMKNYYNDITLNNLALISTLKEQIEELKANHDRMEKQLIACQAENKRLADPLKQAQSELGLLRRQLTSYEQDKVTLANTKKHLALVTKELEDLRWENDVLELRFEKVEKERDRLHGEFVGAVLDVQQKTGLKGALLEKRITSMRSGVSQKIPVSVTDCSKQTNIEQQSASGRNSRPASVPIQTDKTSETQFRWDQLGLSRRPRPKPLDDDIARKRFEPRGVKGRNRFRRPHLSELPKTRWIKAVVRKSRTAPAKRSMETYDGWSAVFSEDGPPRTSSRFEPEPQSHDSRWAASHLPTRGKNSALFSPKCICGQHLNGCRMTAFDKATTIAESINWTFDYLTRNHTKHRYYPQILDCLRNDLSPIHSQEHPSEPSVPDNTDKSAKSIIPEESRRPDTELKDSVTSQKIRPFSASMSYGRDTAFTKEKMAQLQSVTRSNMVSSLVFSRFVPLAPRPNLPWLHGIKSRYLSAYLSQKKREYADSSNRSDSIDVEVQTSEPSLTASSSAESACPLLENAAVQETKSVNAGVHTDGYISQILRNPFQLSYAVSHMDRNYAAIVTSPENNDLNFDTVTKSLVQAWTEDCASFGPLPLSKVVNNDSLPKRPTAATKLPLSVSPLRLIDIESEGSDTSSQAMDTPRNISNEDTGTGISSLTSPFQVDNTVPFDLTKSVDVENSLPTVKSYWASRDNSVERKNDRTPLKRKFKASILRRLKLKLMICSYMLRHDEEGDVNFVHPSARKRVVESTSLYRFEDSTCNMAEISLGSGLTKYQRGEESASADASVAKPFEDPSFIAAIDEKPLHPKFCYVCQSEITLMRELVVKGQLCCDECRQKADALLAEYERSREEKATYSQNCDGNCTNGVFSTEKIIGESLQKECSGHLTNTQAGTNHCLAQSDELASNSDMWANSCPVGDSVDTDSTSNAGAEWYSSCRILDGYKLVSKSGDDVTRHAKQLDDSCQTVLENQATSVLSEAGLVHNCCVTKFDVLDAAEALRTGLVDNKDGQCLKESSRERHDGRDVLFTLSAVQTAIRSAMRMINPIKSPDRPSPVQSPSFRAVIFPGTPRSVSPPLTYTITDTSSDRLSPPLTFSLKSSSSCSSPSISSEHQVKTPATPDLCPSQCKFKDPTYPLSSSDPQQLLNVDPPQERFDGIIPPESTSDPQEHPNITSATSVLDLPRGKCEDASSSQSFPEPQLSPRMSPAVSDLNQPQHKTGGPTFKTSISVGVDSDSCALNKSYIRPMAVPRGTLKSNPRKLTYTKFPVRTYELPVSKMSCVSKPKNMLVFYEVSKLRDKSQRVQTNTQGGENETAVKDPFSLPRVSFVDIKPKEPSQFTLRPSRSNLLVSKDTPIVDIRQEADIVAQNERLQWVGASAKIARSHNCVDQKRGSPKFSDGRFDLLVRGRRESWILSQKNSFPSEVTDSSKSRHRSDEIANENDVRWPRDKQSLVAANQDERCQCLKSGRKCSCSLTNHLHIRSLNPSRPKFSERLFPNRELPLVAWEEDRVKTYRDCSFKKRSLCTREAWSGEEEFKCRSLQFCDSPARKAKIKTRPSKSPNELCFPRQPVVQGRLITFREDSYQSLSFQKYGSGALRSSDVRNPIIPNPPPPSPQSSPCSPTSHRDTLSRRHADEVSSRGTHTLEDQSHCSRNLPPLPSKRRPRS